MLDKEKLEQLYNSMQKCSACDLCKFDVNIYEGGDCNQKGKQKGQGEGSKYLFIGEAPSYYRLGESTFIGGPSGRILKSIMDELDVNVKDCYFTNLLKCSLKNNKSYLSHYAKCCFDSVLSKELEIINPCSIVCLGSRSSEYFGLQFGEKKDYNGKVIYSTWHPNYIGYKPEIKEAYINGLKDFFNECR